MPPAPPPPTATEFARRAPQAGFLQKLGTNIPSYKRRFFVLQPTTQLYYFLSPQDAIPRGAIAVDDADIREGETLADGRTRFSLEWPDGRQIQLEARSQEMAQSWCTSLEQERLPYVRAQWESTQQELAQAKYEIKDLKRQIDNYRFVEQDRDGALEDARRWKEQFEALDESIRLLANHVRKLPATSPSDAACTNEEDGEEKVEESCLDNKHNVDQGKGQGSGHDEKDATAATTGDESAPTKDSGHGSGEAAGLSTDLEPKPINDNASNSDQGDDPPNAEDKSASLEAAKVHHKPLKADENKKEEIDCDDVIEGSSKRNNQEDDHSTTEDANEGNDNRRDISLLDDDAAAEAAAASLFENKNIIDDLDAPGQHFPSLVNACQQLRENLQLASDEAAIAVEDTKTAQHHAKALQTRMSKAEKQLCQLWEENCSIRKTLKQKKREKRVLVREVKTLMEKELQYEAARQMDMRQRSIKTDATTLAAQAYAEDDASTMIGSDEERLINELEEHVVSSIRLHEEFLSAGKKPFNEQPKREIGGAKRADLFGAATSSSSTATTSESTHSGMGVSKMTRRQSTNSTQITAIAENISRKAKKSLPAMESHDAPVASLFDRSASDSESESEEFEDGKGSPLSASPSFMVTKPNLEDKFEMKKPVYDEIDERSISSVAASFGGSSVGRSSESSPLRPNPLLQLDKSEEEPEQVPHQMDEARLFKPISVAQRGTATSRLVCPFADVVKTKPKRMVVQTEGVSAAAEKPCQDMEIYHLTFYTRKIGLQFQKVPPPPAKSRGLLTDAMTADLAGDAHGSSKTAAELKRVAAIWAKSTGGDAGDADNCLQVATPIDAVLVCGFDGFDDSGNNVRPKLGARLVAFDGVSVEVGKWTFDSIRKSIQARGRPLTLSFRNDFLTVDQREIMTKVVAQMEKAQPRATPIGGPQRSNSPLTGGHVEYKGREHDVRPFSAAPSLQEASSHETAHFVNDTTLRTSNTIHVPIEPGQAGRKMDDVDDDLTVSTTGYYSSDYHHSSNLSEPYHHTQSRRFTASSVGTSNSYKRPGSYNFRSFSEAGSSASALSSAIGPLLSNLLSPEKRRVILDPEYLRRRDPVELTPQHQDFESNLL